MKKITLLACALAMLGCASKPTPHADINKLRAITASLPADHQARYDARHPVETLNFFGIKPGDTVIEALPGEGWYSKILVPYLGNRGQLIGVDYSLEMFPLFGGFATPEFIEKRKSWPATWVANSAAWSDGNGAATSAYTFADLPASLTGQVDAVLFIRALHNLARFDAQGNYLQHALKETHRVLKPNGVVGIVQHAMADDKPDAWATGAGGYLKRSAIVKFMTDAGFVLVAESDINQNPNDNPQAGDTVWRLPPSLNAPDADREKNRAIGETNRATLLFRKR